MRITGGLWASRRLNGPGKGALLRPTPDALREQAFAILAPRAAGAVFLDLFAGTGVNSLEALSRGADRAFVVERARDAAELIRGNVALMGVPPERVHLFVQPAMVAVETLAGLGVRCALGWCDPPFAEWEAGVSVLVRARQLGLFLPDALVVVEAPTTRQPAPAGFVLDRRLRGAMLVRNVVGEGGADGG